MVISIIIPLYNSRDTIQHSVESVLNQSIDEPLEIIIVNDGSTDDSEYIVNNIIKTNTSKDRTIKLINQNNKGVSTARNIGIKHSKGEYLAFLDSDDIWHPQKLEIIIHTMIDNNVKFIGHGYTNESVFPRLEGNNKLKKISFSSLLLKNFAVTPSIVIRKEICEQFNESMSHTEDHELWLRIALNHDVYFLDSPLVKLGRPELSAGGLSADLWKMRKGEIQMFINTAKRKKVLIPSIPFLIGFSLLKHARKTITNQINRSKKESH